MFRIHAMTIVTTLAAVVWLPTTDAGTPHEGAAALAPIEALVPVEAERPVNGQPGFTLESSGGCTRTFFSAEDYFTSEGDPMWLSAVSLPPRTVNPVSKAALTAIVKGGFRSLYRSWLDKYIWTVTWPVEVQITGDLNYSFSFDPGAKGSSVRGVMAYLQRMDTGYRVTGEIFHALSRFNTRLEREFGVTGMGRCDYASIWLEIDVDL